MVKYTTKDITVPKSGLEVCTDSYWLCEDGNPQKALFHGSSRQCNIDKRISEWVWQKSYESDPKIQIVFVKTAFVPRQD